MMIGDRVAYSANFLRSIGAQTGELGQARGTIQAIERLAKCGVELAHVKWGSPDVPERVNVKNLCRVGGTGFAAI